MARQKAEDSLLYLTFQRVSVWGSLAILAAVYVTFRFLLPGVLGSRHWLTVYSIVYAPVLTFVAALFAMRAQLDKYQRRKLLEKQTSPGTVRAMSWQQFEQLVGEAYRRQGYRVEETGGGGPDGGVDLILRRNGETALVQCKRWKQARVGVRPVRELRGAVARDGATRGIFVTCGEFTAEAVAEAQGQPPLALVDGKALLELVRQAQGQTAPAQETTPPVPDAPAAPPACPNCGEPMVRRTARSGANAGSQFWGCPAFPRCRGTRHA
jgi:restriction system protein